MDSTSKRGWSFSLRTLVFWVVPYAAVCASIMSCKLAMMRPGPPESAFDWHRRIMVFGVTLIWVVLFWEDRQAIAKASRDSAAQNVDQP